MKIAIDASPAFLHLRTGIEEYSYQLIKHLRPHLKDHDVTLFLRPGTSQNIDFQLPPSWKHKELRSPKYWTYFRLSWALLFGRYDRLFVPGHIVPPIRPKYTVVVVHGLEYEKMPDSYSPKERRLMRFGLKKSCSFAKYIICVSNNTKRDLVSLYGVSRKKIRVIYEGVNLPVLDTAHPRHGDILKKYDLNPQGYLLFIGRIEHRKNILGILKAYEILREHFRVSHKLVLAGKTGYGWEEIAREVEDHPFSDDIVITGFVSNDDKWSLLQSAGVFVFPTLYEGFGLPILEAQHVGVPVVTSDVSSLPEIVGDSALQSSPYESTQIAEHIHTLISDKDIRQEIIRRGYENTKRFDWKKTARLSAKVLLGNN